MITALRDRLRRLLGDEIAGKLAGPALISILVKGSSAVLSYFMLVVFARLLAPDEYGYFGVAMNAAIVLSVVAALGLPVAVMRFWPSLLETKATDAAKGFAVSSFRILCIASALMLAAGVVLSLSGAAAPWLGSPWAPFLITCLAALLAISEYLSGLLRAQGHTAWALVPRDVLWRLLAPLFAFGVMTFLVSFNAALSVACCVAVLALLTGAQMARAWRATQDATGAVAARTDWRKWRTSLLPIAGASILFAMVQQLDVVVVGGLLGPAQAGAYFAAQKTASLLGLVMIAGGMVAAPLMSAAFHGGRLQELQKLCRLLTLGIALTTFAGLVVLALAGRPLLGVFDPSYRDAYAVMMILSFGFAVDALAGPTAYLMQMTKLESSYLKIMAGSYALVLALQLVFVPVYGMMAAAMATALGYVLWNAFAIWLLRRKIGVDSSILSFFLAPKPVNHD